MEIRILKIGIPAMVIALCGFAAAQSPDLVSARAQLNVNVDSAKVTPGETITAKLTSNVKSAGEMELREGTTLVGKVEQVQKSSGDAPAQLSVVFDQAKLRDGQTIPIKATLLSAYPATDDLYYAEGGYAEPLAPEQPHVIAADATFDQTPGLLGRVELRSDAQSDVSGVFTSKSRNINLSRGTQFWIAIAPESESQAQSGN
jgi:hypothetical protein